jgi:inhibitor of cysteine peptidase
VVKLSGEESIPASTPTPGAPGQEKFTFTATGNGQAAITLNYIRPWETDVDPAETRVINIIVSPNGTSKKIESDIPPSSLEIYSGDKFVFYIESNPSTGYTWQMASGTDENVVELSSQETIPAPATTPTPVVGAPGQEKFTFTATGKGLAAITLNYVRPWETDVAPANTRIINVKVK